MADLATAAAAESSVEAVLSIGVELAVVASAEAAVSAGLGDLPPAPPPPPPPPEPLVLLRDADRAHPLVSASGRPLRRAPRLAPPVVTPPSGLLFDLAQMRPGVPGSNNQFNRFDEGRDWAATLSHPTQGFAGVRWQPTWLRSEGFFGDWTPAEGEVRRIYRKGDSGADLRTLVFECGPNPATIPVGDAVVVWWTEEWFGGVSRITNTLDLNGFQLPLRQKLTVTGGSGSALWDAFGVRTVEVRFGEDLPPIDYVPPTAEDPSAGTFYRVRLRHWEFYADPLNRTLRRPLDRFAWRSKEEVLKNGGWVMLGGLQHIPTWRDWTLEYHDFGASLVEELWRKECEGLAYHFGETDPRRLAVELENEPTRAGVGRTEGGPETNETEDIGYHTLLREVWYPIARQEWGPERTLCVKSSGFGSLDHLQNEFNVANPDGGNAHLVNHNYDNQAHRFDLPGWPVMNYGTAEDSAYHAQTLLRRIEELGYKGGGMTEWGVLGWGFRYEGPDRGQRIGRMIDALARRGLYCFVWSLTGDSYRCSSIQNIDGADIEAMDPDVAPYCARAGLTFGG